MTPGTALLVGGSSEIGMAVLVRLLGPVPRRVILAGRPSSELWWNAEKLRDAGYSVSTTQYDAGLDADELDGMLEHACAEDRLELAIVAVGSMASKSFADGVVVNGLAVSVLLRALVHRKPAQIVVLSSAAAVRPRQSIAAYSLGKQLADSAAVLLARETAGTGVRVLVVRPGFVTTRMTADLPKPPLATSPERVAGRVAAAVEARKTIVWVPGVMGLVVRAVDLVPRRLLPETWR
ncbi:decaprenylphospho-beta-D-erythro-pentofuranosid-2-ulose 2-reductase [Kribbella sp. VKM Ac-2571]|uniref:SDR family NAD(P)-dependent oxidoreductase n=1 Tax=Kribbella sp. VKM Ac-2571 TaxID=2512222 RepID=UPI0010CF716A|nr:SDR family NAD(P)-dependent oxidoreductase [Kribbella sp. VKM Ac-2571]TDO58851.1 decaprenylphospho-beta-D-erythro-pentofuranosid-2-ulose 2-reductase [Kribbella sp. VKM Ac-2571]